MQAENNCEPTNIIQLLQFHTLPSNQRCSEFSTSRTLYNNVYLTSSHRPHKHTYLLKLILSYPSLYHSLSNLCQGWRKLLTVSLISHATVVHSVTDRTIFAFNTFANFFTWSLKSYPTALWCSPHPHQSKTSGTALLCSGTSVKWARETEGFDFDMIPLCSLVESSGDTSDDADQQAYCWYSAHWDAVAVLEATLEEGDFSLMRDWFASCRSRCSLAARGTRAADPLIHWWHTCQEDTKCQMHDFLTALSNT